MKYEIEVEVDLGNEASRKYTITTTAGNRKAAQDQIETLITEKLKILTIEHKD